MTKHQCPNDRTLAFGLWHWDLICHLDFGIGTSLRRSLAAVLLLGLLVGPVLGWGGWTHKRMTYWAWRFAKLPPSDGTVQVRVAWNMDSIANTLGYASGDAFSALTALFVKASGADFNVDTLALCNAVSDSALFTDWGRRPDDYDQPSAALGGALWGHMYLPAGGGFGDGMCKFFYDKAVRTYKQSPADKKNRRKAYCYLALASHYLEDCGFPPHNEKNYLDAKDLLWQTTYHHAVEDKIGGDSFWFKHFDPVCSTYARTPMPAFDPVAAVHGLAWEVAWYDQEFKAAAQRSDPKDMIKTSNKCIKAIMPRMAGLFLAFKQTVKKP